MTMASGSNLHFKMATDEGLEFHLGWGAPGSLEFTVVTPAWRSAKISRLKPHEALMLQRALSLFTGVPLAEDAAKDLSIVREANRLRGADDPASR